MAGCTRHDLCAVISMSSSSPPGSDPPVLDPGAGAPSAGAPSADASARSLLLRAVLLPQLLRAVLLPQLIRAVLLPQLLCAVLLPQLIRAVLLPQLLRAVLLPHGALDAAPHRSHMQPVVAVPPPAVAEHAGAALCALSRLTVGAVTVPQLVDCCGLGGGCQALSPASISR